MPESIMDQIERARVRWESRRVEARYEATQDLRSLRGTAERLTESLLAFDDFTTEIKLIKDQMEQLEQGGLEAVGDD